MTRLVFGAGVFAAVAATAACGGSGSSLSPAAPSASGVSSQRFATTTPAMTALSQHGHDDLDTRVTGEDTAEFEGRITAIDAAARNIVVRATTIHVPANAIIRHGQASVAFTDVRIGDRVHVRASRDGTTIVARLILLQNEQDDAGETEVEGAVAGLAAACPAITFDIGALSVVTSDKTTFRGVMCAQIINNLELDIRGTLQANGTLLASSVSVSREHGEDDD